MLLLMVDKILLRKRLIIETVNDQLKNISNIEHSRLIVSHRLSNVLNYPYPKHLRHKCDTINAKQEY